MTDEELNAYKAYLRKETLTDFLVIIVILIAFGTTKSWMRLLPLFLLFGVGAKSYVRFKQKGGA